VTDIQVMGLNPPEGWTVLPLSKVASITRKPRGLGNARTTIPFVSMDYLSSVRLVVDKWDMRSVADIKSGVYFEEGDVLLAKITPCLENGKLGLVESIPGGWGYATTEVFPLRALDVSPEFLALYLKTSMVRSLLGSKLQGTTGRQRLPKDALGSLPVPVPPPAEQRSIVHVMRAVQRAEEHTEQVIAAANELRRSFLRKTFYSGSWETHPLGDVLDGSGGSVQTGPFGSLLHADSYVTDGLPFIMPADMTPDGRVNHGSVKRVSNKDHDRLSRYQLAVEDVLVGRRGEIGRRALITTADVPSLCGSGSLRIRPGSAVEPRFLAALFELPEIREFLVSQAVGSTMLNLNSKILRSLPIPLPPFQVQVEIADQLDTMARKVGAEEQRRAALNELFVTLLHELMSGATRIADGLKVA
jgi:type I restriction enzyme S subunit